MASGYSQPGSTYRHLNPVDTFDEQLVATVLGAKQQKYDANLAKIDAALEQYGGVDLARTKDKQYLQEKLNTLTDQINGAGMQDLSSSSVTRNITQHLDKALDENILEQMANTQKLRKFGADVKSYKEENDGAYAKENEAYALDQAGYQEYMSGGKDTLGNLEYNPYVDVSKAKREILDEAFSVEKGITRKLPNNEGHLVERTHYGLTPSDVRRKVSGSLSPQELKQLEINSWAKYGENAPERYEQYVSPKVDELKKERASLLLNYEGLTKAEKVAVDEKKDYIDSTIKEIKAVKESPSALYRFLGKEDLIGELSEAYSPVMTNESYTTDSAYYKELTNISKQANAATGRSDFNNDGVDDVGTRSLATDPEDKWIPTKKAEEEIKRYESDLRSIFNVSYNRLSREEQTAFDEGYKQHLEANDLDDNPANKTSFMLEKSNSGRGGYFNAEEYHMAKGLEREYREKLEIKNKNYQEALNEQEEISFEEFFREVKAGNDNNIMMFNEQGKKVSMVDYLKGINSTEDLSEEQKKTLLKSTYTDITLSQTKNYTGKGNTHATNTYNISRLAKVNGEVGRDLPMLVNPDNVIYSGYSEGKDFKTLKEDMQLPPQMTRKQFEENIVPLVEGRTKTEGGLFSGFIDMLGLDEIGEKVTTNMRHSAFGGAVGSNLIIGGEGTQTREDLERGIKEGLHDKARFFDDSVEDDVDLRRALTNREDFQGRYEDKMAEDASKFAQNQEIMVQPSGTRQGEEVAAHKDLLRYNGAFNPKKHIYVRKTSVEGQYQVYQVLDDSTTIKNGEKLDKEKTVSAIVSERDLEGDPFFDNITKQKNTRRITAENTKELVSSNTGFADEKEQRDYIISISKATGIRNEKQLSRFTSQGAKSSLIEKHKDLFSDEGGEGFKQIMKDAIDNSHLFRLKLKADDIGRFEMGIQYPVTEEGKEVWKNLKTMPTGQTDITETVKMVDMAPQTFFYEYIDRLLTTIERQGSEVVEDDLKLLQKILYPKT